MEKKTLNVGLVGYGFMGRTHSNAFLQVSRFFDVPYRPVLQAICARNPARAQAFARKHGIPRVHQSYDALLADPDVDAIYNPLPNSLHAQWSIRCAEAGKPCLCEKPLASNAPEAQTIVDAFAKRNLLFAEAFMYRFHPQTQQVKDMVESGAIGEAREMQASFSFVIRDEDDIRLSKPLAGGALMDIGSTAST